MSACHTWVLICDQQSCLSSFDARRDTASETRKLAAAIGWQSTTKPTPRGPWKSIDLCPMHAIKEPTE